VTTLVELTDHIAAGLSQWLDPIGDPAVTADLRHDGTSAVDVPTHDGFHVRDDDRNVLVLPWRFRGVDTRGVHGMAPSGRQVIVRGVTIDFGDLTTAVHYVNWLDVYEQLGLPQPGRTIAAPG
jgi:hypothetical protein